MIDVRKGDIKNREANNSQGKGGKVTTKNLSFRLFGEQVHHKSPILVGSALCNLGNYFRNGLEITENIPFEGTTLTLKVCCSAFLVIDSETLLALFLFSLCICRERLSLVSVT